jgi:hypothetical protein
MDEIAVHRVELGAYALLREFDDVRHQIEAAGWSLTWVGEPDRDGKLPLSFEPVSATATCLDVTSRVSYEVESNDFRDVVNELTRSGYFFSGEFEAEDGRVLLDFAPLSEITRLSEAGTQEGSVDHLPPPAPATTYHTVADPVVPRRSLVRDAAVAGMGIYAGHEIWESASDATDLGGGLLDGLLGGF